MTRHNARAGFEMDGPYYQPARERLQALLAAILRWLRCFRK